MKQSPLHKAAHKGDLDTLIRLIDDGADVNARDKYGCSLLMVASLQGHADVARYLLDHGADLHAVDHLGKSAIHQAAIRGPEIVRLLLGFGADVNSSDISGYTPLHLAAAHCKRDLVIDTSEILLEAGANVDAQRSRWGTTALWSAAIANRDDLVHFLVRHGASIDIRDNEGRTVLMFVIKMGLFDAMPGHLLAYGADVNARDAQGRTALMYAAHAARQSTLKTLLAGGADIGLQDASGRSALMYVAGEVPTDSEIGMLGREAGANPGVRNASNWGAEKEKRLAKAYRRRADVVRHLLECGADRDLRDAGGRTALDVALENARNVGDDNAEVVRALRVAS